jgi:hypothetical protein
MISIIQDRVEGIFYTRWMNLPSQPNMTATEVLQRRDEMLRLLGPMVSQRESVHSRNCQTRMSAATTRLTTRSLYKCAVCHAESVALPPDVQV